MSQNAVPNGKVINLTALLAQIEQMREELQDLRVLYENTVEHSSAIENELEGKNQKINNLLTTMRMYLPPQLYDSIVRGTFDTRQPFRRKKLTMFFSDIVGFTQITDSTEPETISGLLNEYLTEMSAIATKYGGTIDKFIGDAIVIFFGDPEFIDDITHARQCVRMGVEMLDTIRVLSRGWDAVGAPGGLRVRMGINTGFCAVGNFGSETRMDYTIIGGQVNIAARLEKIADPNSIFMSESTYSLVKDIVEVEVPGKIRVKGIHYPVAVYKVIGLKRGSMGYDSLLERSDDTMFLHPISFNRLADSEQYREHLSEVLNHALEFLHDCEGRIAPPAKNRKTPGQPPAGLPDTDTPKQ